MGWRVDLALERATRATGDKNRLKERNEEPGLQSSPQDSSDHACAPRLAKEKAWTDQKCGTRTHVQHPRPLGEKRLYDWKARAGA